MSILRCLPLIARTSTRLSIRSPYRIWPSGGTPSQSETIFAWWAWRWQYMKNLLSIRVAGTKGKLQLFYHINAEAYRQLKERVLGKRVLFTDQNTWTTEAIIAAYRAQFQVENAFRQMKNPFFVSWSPMWHWTDSKIRVHALYCIRALILAGLLQRQLFQKLRV